MEEITLLDGRMLPASDIQLDSDGWNFSRVSSGERLTYKIKQSDKRYYFPGYDYAFGNDQISKDLSGAELTPQLEESVTKIFAGQIVTDPLAAPADFAAAGVEKLKAVASSPITWAVAGLVVVGLVIYFVPRPR